MERCPLSLFTFYLSDAEATLHSDMKSRASRAPAGSLPHPLWSLSVCLSWPQPCSSPCFICFQGNLRPEEALQALTIYEGKFGRLKDDREKCAKAKEALELTDMGLLSGSEERVQV